MSNTKNPQGDVEGLSLEELRKRYMLFIECIKEIYDCDNCDKLICKNDFIELLYTAAQAPLLAQIKSRDAEIERLQERFDRLACWESWHSALMQTIGWLKGQKELKGEGLREVFNQLKDQLVRDGIQTEKIKQLTAEVERLKAENAELKKAIEKEAKLVEIEWGKE